VELTLQLQEIVMEHYSIHATEIFISELLPNTGWRRGDSIRYQVKNCVWESEIEIQFKMKTSGLQLHGKQIFKSGDLEKMLFDKEAVKLAMQAHIYKQNHDRRQIKWL
jgi:hypothetical protein